MSQASSSTFNPDLRAALIAMVRKRVPESEVEDIVQQTLTEAIESPHAPNDGESLRRWIFGVAKNKVVDYHRRAGRLTYDLPDVAGSDAPHDEEDMLRWAARNLPEGDDAKKTLGWMLREGDGEKLESIAESEHVPAPRVRQRVSRLRRHFKDNWQRELALLAAVGVIISAIVIYLKHKNDTTEPIAHDPNGVPIDPRAEPLRKHALERCAAADWAFCVDELDQAKKLDPAGDARPEVQQARQAADKALTPPAPSSAPITPPPPPTASAVPTPSPFSTDSMSDMSSDGPSPAPRGSNFVPTKPVPTPKPSKIDTPMPKKPGFSGKAGKAMGTEMTPPPPPPTKDDSVKGGSK